MAGSEYIGMWPSPLYNCLKRLAGIERELLPDDGFGKAGKKRFFADAQNDRRFS
jgi:hypothetical protein